MGIRMLLMIFITQKNFKIRYFHVLKPLLLAQYTVSHANRHSLGKAALKK